MASPSFMSVDLTIQPDLQPLYPTPHQVAHLLSPNVGLSPGQKAELVSHCLTRACVFGDFNLLSYLLSDPQAQSHIDLGKHDEDGLGLISTTILGFGSEVERDMEREECVRLLVSEGADVNLTDDSGWTALHHAALLAPPTLVTFLVTHGCSPFAVTRRKSTALDIVNAYAIVPGREDVALLLEEAMRVQGWEGGRMEERRRLLEKQLKRVQKRKELQESIGKILGLDSSWWGDLEENLSSDALEDEAEEDFGEGDVFTPSPDYTSMIVFSPETLPDIFQTLITDFKPTLRNTEPANALYMLSRFACLNCDDNWMEDLIIGATDTIEETFFNRGDDLATLVFWQYNLTVWLHLMRCDEALKDNCEELGSYSLIEEILNSVFVFIIRFAERRIDQLLDSALLDYSPLSSEFDSIQFESEWSFLRSFGGSKLKKPPPIANNTTPGSPAYNKSGTVTPAPQSSTRSPSPPSAGAATTKFASLKQTFSRGRPQSGTSIQTLFNEAPPPSPQDITSFMTALQTLFTLSNINPALITQLWSQVMFWAACEIFNRILTRKKYLCRSRAVQISMNISVIEEWIGNMGLPRGIGAHFAPVRDLLNWLQCLSSITEFSNLIATIQTMKHMNPLQMRRAVRDYKYEVNEGRMTEECTQYLAQLQKDWERHRVRVGVETLRKEIGEREREREELNSPPLDGCVGLPESIPPSPSTEAAQRNIDKLFDRSMEKSAWEPASAPEALGELLDSRHMLPLLLPSDPRMLGAIPLKQSPLDADRRHIGSSNGARASNGARGSMEWRLQSRRIRDVGVRTLQWIDGISSASRWYRPLELEPEVEAEGGEEESPPPYSSNDPNPSVQALSLEAHITPLARTRSARSRARPSIAETSVDSELNGDVLVLP